MKIKKEWKILFAVMPLTFMTTLDSSIVNVALPTMAKELGTTMGGIEWIVTSYLITICATILLFGRLGDIYGKNKLFKFGVGLFTAGSLLCGVSGNLTLLVISRIIQGLGAAAAMATNQGIITEAFSPKERGRALGLIGTAVALGTMVGPTVGGFIVSITNWNYIFLINIPVGILVYIAVFKVLKINKKTSDVSLDVKGSVLFTLSIIMIFASINLGQVKGYTNPIIILCAVIACILFTMFIKLEKSIESPLLDINIFKNKLFSLSIFCAFTSFVAIGSINIILPFYLQDVLRLSPSMAGIIMTVSPLVLAIVAPISGHLSDKLGAEKISFVGVATLSIGLFLLTILGENTALGLVAILVGIMALGSGMFQSPNNSLIMSSVEKTKLGVAGSVNALVRNLGIITGIALSTSLLYNRMSSKIGYPVASYVDGRGDVFIYAMRVVFIVVGVICLIGAILTLLRVINKKNVLNKR